MSKKYDLESFMEDLKCDLVKYLNPQIKSVSDEKNDGLELKEIPERYFVIQSLDDEIMNSSIFCLIQCIDIATQSAGPYPANTYQVIVMIVVAGTKNQLKMVNRMFRYGRALEETIQKQWVSAGRRGVNKINMTLIPPQDYQNLNSTQDFRVVGVQLNTTIV